MHAVRSIADQFLEFVDDDTFPCAGAKAAPARQFPSPVLVYNSHRQFEELRADGRYKKMQKATCQRDIALQGSINPNLADFGCNSEAR